MSISSDLSTPTSAPKPFSRSTTLDPNNDDDYTSSSGSSSEEEEDSDDASDAEHPSASASSNTIPTLRSQRKPAIKPITAYKSNASDLRARLSSFLPMMKEANAALDAEGEEGLRKRRIEVLDVKEGENGDGDGVMEGVVGEEEESEDADMEGGPYVEMVRLKMFLVGKTSVC